MVTITLVVNPDQVLLETYEIDLIKPKIYIVLGVMLQNKATRSLPQHKSKLTNYHLIYRILVLLKYFIFNKAKTFNSNEKQPMKWNLFDERKQMEWSWCGSVGVDCVAGYGAEPICAAGLHSQTHSHSFVHSTIFALIN